MSTESLDDICCLVGDFFTLYHGKSPFRDDMFGTFSFLHLTYANKKTLENLKTALNLRVVQYIQISLYTIDP